MAKASTKPKDEFLGKLKIMGDFVGKRQDHIRKYLKYGSKLHLLREPENEYDPNAILIQLSVRKGTHFLDLGYVPKEQAAIWAPMMDAGVKLKATFRTKVITDNGKYIAIYLNMKKEK